MMTRVYLGAALLLAAFAAQDALAQPRVNLTATGVVGPTSAVVGRTISIAATVQSTGTDLPGNFRWTAYLAMNGSLDGALSLGTFGPVALSGTTPQTFNQSVQLPAGVTGRWSLAIEADSQDAVDEFDEYDNIAFSAATLVIRDELPDMHATYVASTEPALRAGEALSINYIVRNDGERVATVTVGAYLSPDAVISTSDSLIGEESITLFPGDAASRTITGNVPAGVLPGDYTIGVIADAAGAEVEISETNNVATMTAGLNVFEDTLRLDTESLPGGTVGIAYHVLLDASGGDGRHRWRLASGRLPDGLMLDEVGGVLSGTPAASGSFNFTLAVTSRGLTTEKMFTVAIEATGAELEIASTEVADGALGQPYEQQLIAVGGEPPYTWSIAPDLQDLPPGLDLRTDGIISGVPTVLGTFHFGILVVDRAGDRDIIELEIDISPPVQVLVVHRELPEATIGVEIDYALQATGGIPPYSWEARSTLPPGLLLTEQGHLVGTPARVGRFLLRVSATDSTRVQNDDTNLIELVVKDDGALRIVTESLPIVTLRTRYAAQLDATGGEPPLEWSLVPGDHLPSGFFMIQGDGMANPVNTAVIKGTALRPSFHAFAVQVEDAYGRRDQRVMLLEIAIPPELRNEGCACVAAPYSGRWPAAMLLLAGLVFLVRRRSSLT